MNRLLSVAALLMALLLTGSLARAQTYDQLLEEAAHQLSQKNYCEATVAFERAFADSTRVGPFDLYAGAGAAANCPGRPAQALRWLLWLARHPKLSIAASDVDQMAQDATLSSLHSFPEWPGFLSSLRQTAARRAAEAHRAAAKWQGTALRQALPTAPKKGSYAAAQPGFALYYAPVDTVRPTWYTCPAPTSLPDPRRCSFICTVASEPPRNSRPPTLGWRKNPSLRRPPLKTPWCSIPSAANRSGGWNSGPRWKTCGRWLRKCSNATISMPTACIWGACRTVAPPRSGTRANRRRASRASSRFRPCQLVRWAR